MVVIGSCVIHTESIAHAKYNKTHPPEPEALAHLENHEIAVHE
jgi:hypothetical protein